jgi:hypothetical protein
MHRPLLSFRDYFKHIRRFHSSDPSFRLTCTLSPRCGVTYKTYSAYRSHVYRHHSTDLHTNANLSISTDADCSFDTIDSSLSDADCSFDTTDNSLCSDEANEDDTETNFYNDEDDDRLSTGPSFPEELRDIDEIISLDDFQKTYTRFLLQLVEEYVLPKKIIQTVSSTIVTLLDLFHRFLNQNSVSYSSSFSSQTTTLTTGGNEKIVTSSRITAHFQDVSKIIEETTRSDYQFVKMCKRYFAYEPPIELVLSSTGEKRECAYFVPASRTLSILLKNEQLLALLQDTACYQKERTDSNSDLMFSIRDGNVGTRIDDWSFLLQLYNDDISLTNPIGAKKDQQKVSMFYLALEDVPDKYRSQIQCVQLLAICKTKLLQVS